MSRGKIAPVIFFSRHPREPQSRPAEQHADDVKGDGLVERQGVDGVNDDVHARLWCILRAKYQSRRINRLQAVSLRVAENPRRKPDKVTGNRKIGLDKTAKV